MPTPPDAPPFLPAGLSSAQVEAITAADPLLCVLAGAGAGKTRVLTLRVARRVGDGAAPDHVLVCTFSRKAAQELRRRLWTLGVPEGVTAGTFHRTALSLLRQHRADRRQGPPEILSDRRRLLGTLLGAERAEEAPRSGGRQRGAARSALVSQLDGEIGWAKARLVSPGAYEAEAARCGRRTPADAGSVAGWYDRYERERRRRGLLDLDDLLVVSGDLLAEDREFAGAVRWRFRHLFVDEMQDVNPAQFRLLTSLLGDEPDLFVVGDPNQSVYGWNGADPTLLQRLPELLGGTRVIRLDENHRSSPQVVRVAASALGLEELGGPTSSRPDGPVPQVGQLATDRDEAEWVAHHVWLARRPGRRWSDLAVLARTNAQLVAVAEALRAARIPFELLAPGGGTAGGARGALQELDDPDEPEDEEPEDEEVEDDTDEEVDDDPDADDTGLLLPGAGPEGGVPGGWAAEVGGWAREGAVVLSTFHRAKGLQWRAVFVIGLCEGLVPLRSARTAEALAEERRLLYVAMTRAEDELFCTWALRRHDDGDTPGRERRPTRWLQAVGAARQSLIEAEPDPGRAVARIAELRAQLAEGGGGSLGRVPAVTRGPRPLPDLTPDPRPDPAP